MGHTCTYAWVPNEDIDSGSRRVAYVGKWVINRDIARFFPLSFSRAFAFFRAQRNRRVENESAGGRNYKVVNPIDEDDEMQRSAENLKILGAYIIAFERESRRSRQGVKVSVNELRVPIRHQCISCGLTTITADGEGRR